MSYILDALRKSETERHQGKVADLGRQLQLIHRPQKRYRPVQAVLAVALLLNAGVLAYVFWPAQEVPVSSIRVTEQEQAAVTTSPVPVTAVQEVQPGSQSSAPSSSQSGSPSNSQLSAQSDDQPDYQSPTVIIPSGYGSSNVVDRNGPRNSQDYNQVDPLGSVSSVGTKVPASRAGGGRVPHLVELPLSFQRSVPDLTVNSHIFASAPQARRVMINNQNLRPGDSFQGLWVEAITEDGVVLSRQGQEFRLGIVRDWQSPR